MLKRSNPSRKGSSTAATAANPAKDDIKRHASQCSIFTSLWFRRLQRGNSHVRTSPTQHYERRADAKDDVPGGLRDLRKVVGPQALFARKKVPMNEHERFDELSSLIAAQTAIVEGLYDKWNAACKMLNNYEREQSALFRRMADRSPQENASD